MPKAHAPARIPVLTVGSKVQPVGDTRNFTLSVDTLPPPGPKPLTPTTLHDLDKVDMSKKPDEARAALLRCLEFYGAVRLDEDLVRVPFGIGADASAREVDPRKAPLELLREAALACVSQATASGERTQNATTDLAPDLAPDGGEAGLPKEQVSLVTRWLSSCPRFATEEHDAVGVAVLLMWSFPESHGVEHRLSTERWETLLQMLRTDAGGLGAQRVREELHEHATPAQVSSTVAAAAAAIGIA